MAYCSSCGEYIPDGQGVCCSMCYGDISYGQDGYYENGRKRSLNFNDSLKKKNTKNM